MQVITRSERDLSVVMPGQKYPTCIAHPSPLLPSPSPREPFHYWFLLFVCYSTPSVLERLQHQQLTQVLRI